METITDHKTLSRKFIEVKDELDEAEKSLTKLLGRRRNDFFTRFAEYKEKQVFKPSKDSVVPHIVNKRFKLEESKEEEEEEESTSEDECESKKVIRSAVKAKVEGNKSRREMILKQNCNKKIQSRNRRMFGMVQSTLKQFQSEAVKRQSQDLKKIEVEQRVEAAKEKEKELVEKQKQELYSKKKEKQSQLECLQKMMQLTESFEIWENNHICLLNYIVTETEPKICFLPASHTPNSEKQLKKSREKIQEIIKKQKASVEKELNTIKESYQSPELQVKNDSNNDTEEPIGFVEETLHLSEDEILFD